MGLGQLVGSGPRVWVQGWPPALSCMGVLAVTRGWQAVRPQPHLQLWVTSWRLLNSTCAELGGSVWAESGCRRLCPPPIPFLVHCRGHVPGRTGRVAHDLALVLAAFSCEQGHRPQALNTCCGRGVQGDGEPGIAGSGSSWAQLLELGILADLGAGPLPQLLPLKWGARLA